MPRIPGGRNNGNNNENPPVSERERTRSRTGDDRDRASYDNGRVRYDWDVYTDPRGDHRGRVGIGHRDERNDIYGSVEFNERTERLKGNVEIEREINDNLGVRGAYGRDNAGYDSGRLGGRASGDDGWVDLQLDFNEKTNRLDGRLKSRYKVSDNTTARAEYTARHKKEDSWKIGARTRTGVGDYVDGEAGRSLTLGDYGAGRWVRKDDGELIDDHWVRYSRKKGLEIKSKAHREGENWEADHSLTRSNDVTKHRASARHVGEHATHTVRTNFEHDARDRTSGDITLGRQGDDYDASLRLRKDKSGLKKARVSGSKDVGGGTSLDGQVDVDEKGRWKVSTGATHELNDDIRASERFSIDHRGVRTYGHEAEIDLLDDKAKVGVEIRHSSEGAHSERLDARYRTESGGRHGVAIEHSETATGRTTNSAEYRYSNPEGRRVSGEVGKTEDNRFVGVSVSNKVDARTMENFDIDWSDDQGLEASGGIRRDINHNTAVEGRIGGSLRDRDIRADVGVEHEFNEDVSMDAGLSFARRDGKIAGNVSVTDALGDDNIGASLRVGAGRTDRDVHANAGGDVSFGNVFGTSTGKLGGDVGLKVTKRVAVTTGRGEAGRLREEVLAGQPEGSGYVRYGLKGRASGKAGISLPVGPGYVETGLKAGKTYAVEFTRLDSDPDLGRHPTRAELEIPGTADELLSLKAGEAVAISGETTHGYMAGGGFGAAMGAVGIGEAGIKAGADATYTVTGKTRTEVMRGGESSARMTLRASDTHTKDAGLKVTVGITPKLPDLGENVGPIGDVTTGLAKGLLSQWMSVGVRRSKESSQGDNRLMDARLDLSDDEVKSAYDTAMKGDWTGIKALHDAGHPGVKLEKSILTDIHEKASPLVVHGLGMSYMSENREVKKDSTVEIGDRQYSVISDTDSNTRAKDGWFVDTKTEVSDHSRTVRPEDGSDLGRIKGEENYLSWSQSKTDSFSSKDEVLEQLALAGFVLGPDGNKDLAKYEKKVGKVDNHRKLWIGPRNELRKTSVRTQITIADEGLDRLESKSEDEIWSALAAAKTALNGEGTPPAWTDPTRRASLASGTGSFRVHGGAIMANPGETLDRAEYREAKQFVSKIAAASSLPEQERNDAVRETLATFKGDPSTIGAMVELLGRDVVRMDLKVDSDAGRKKTQYDFKLTTKGEEYDVVKTTFGTNL